MTESEQANLADMLMFEGSVDLAITVLENMIEEEQYLGQNFFEIWTVLDIAFSKASLGIAYSTRVIRAKNHIYILYRAKQGR